MPSCSVRCPRPQRGGLRRRRSCLLRASSSTTLVERIEHDERLRSRAIADLEALLRAEGVEPTPAVVAHLRRQLRA